ncbi:hypothetical protein P5673_017779 [Acropora cervicornis]|uniref:YqaJ viral recombinase domain-containing protein n=1 Tax=Acropora cervicornis TaxID=6130 RepID=A0AAD9QE74_ACRCE|nr:hypothetical protein P5673_017779 [Acropora cervicornis]
MSKKTVEKGYLPGYHESLPDQLSKDRYGSKLELIEVKKVPYSKISDIVFSKYGGVNKRARTESKVPISSHDEILDFLSNVKAFCDSKPAVMALMKEFSDAYVPSSINEDLPPVLSTYFDKELSTAEYDTVMSVCEQKLFIYDINAKEQIAVEERTRKQANSRLWFRMRTGRVTASKFKSACVTDPLKPSHSLIMSICHPELVKFTNEATKWGCNHEAAAKEAYFQVQDNRHQGLKIEESGFFISTEYGFLGATPDGLVSCKCCGNGVIEIKCPFCQKDKDLTECMKDKNFCLESTPDGKHQLKRNHPYFYQVNINNFFLL